LVETDEYDRLLATKEQSRFEFDAALNASLKQEKLYDSVSTLIWQKMMKISTHSNDFNIFSVYNWLTVIALAITVINSFVLVILCLRFKAFTVFLMSARKTKANFVYTMSTPINPQSSSLTAEEIWASIQQALSDFWGMKTLIMIILFLLIILIPVIICRPTLKYSQYQTYIRLDLLNANHRIKRVITYLSYSSDFYRFEVNFRGFTFDRLFYFASIKLNNCLTITQKLTGVQERVATRIMLTPWETRAMMKMSTSNYSALVIIFDNKHKIVDMINLGRGRRRNKQFVPGPSIDRNDEYCLTQLDKRHRHFCLNYWQMPWVSGKQI